MKSPPQGILLLFSLIMTAFYIQAQESEYGIDASFGSTIMQEYFDFRIIKPLQNNPVNFMHVGVNYYYTPPKADFNLKSGIVYNYRNFNSFTLDYLRVPLGLDFNIGNKFRLILGGGFFASYLLSYNYLFSIPSDFIESKINFQIGWYSHIGLGIPYNDNYRLVLRYQLNRDITKMYEYERYSPGGIPYKTEIRGSDGIFILSVIRRMEKKGG